MSLQSQPSRELVKVTLKTVSVTNLNFSFLKETIVMPFKTDRYSCVGEILPSVPKASKAGRKAFP